MTAYADYAEVFEHDIRPRRVRRVRRAAAWALWGALLVVRPKLAVHILRERRR